MLVAHILSNEYTAEAEEKRQYQIAYVKDASAKLKNLLETINDKEIRKKVERVYDALYSSPVKSHPSLEQIETKILTSINGLEEAILSENRDAINMLTDSLVSAINERNTWLKTLG